MAKVKIKPLIRDTYLAVVKNSVNSEIFKNFYALVGRQKKDLTRDGELSCAYFVSAVLKTFDLIQKVHLTVRETIKDMEKSNWFLVKKPESGAVLIWEKKEFSPKDKHSHIGFYIGKNLAVSNSSLKRKIVLHPSTFENKRKIASIYWHKKLK